MADFGNLVLKFRPNAERFSTWFVLQTPAFCSLPCDMQHHWVTVLDSLTADDACYGLGKLSANALCRSDHRSLLFFVLLALVCFSVPQYVLALSPEEIIAVSAMRETWPQLGITYSAWNGNVSTACNPAWDGLTCDGSQNIVTILLKSLGLAGTIPPELGNLASIQNLNLYNNSLIGAIPPQLGNLNLLEQLNLNNNQLIGAIPTQLGSLNSLENLHLNNNQLNGIIPPQLGNLNLLEQLYLSNNQLIGAIPPQLGNLTAAQNIFLDNNQLNGTIPPELGNLNLLQQLYLDHNQLIGAIPTQLGNATSLHILSLGNNQLNGTIPPQLGNATSLEELYLYTNQLSGPFPMELLRLPDLFSLDVSFNDLSLCPPPNATNFTIPSFSCNLKNQNHDYCDPQCTAWYSSLPCAVDFEVCTPTIPVTPVAVTDAPDTPADFPVPSATPASPSLSCSSQTPPGPSFSCINGVWTSAGNVSGVTIQISSPTTIEGDLDLSNTVTFVGLDGSLSVDGCVNIEGIEIVLSDEDVERIKKSSNGQQSLELLKQGKTTGCGTLDSIPLSVKHPKSCTKVVVRRDPSTSTSNAITVLFKLNSTNCHLWWIIFLSVLGGIVVIMLVFVLLATFNKRVQEKVRPFWIPNTQIRGISRYVGR